MKCENCDMKKECRNFGKKVFWCVKCPVCGKPLTADMRGYWNTKRKEDSLHVHCGDKLRTVWEVSYDGTKCVFDTLEEAKECVNGDTEAIKPEEYEVKEIKMSNAEYYGLPDFEGF